MRAMHLSAESSTADMGGNTVHQTVLLQPEEIRKRTTEELDGMKLVMDFVDRDVHVYVYTTGVLEWCLEQGYTVFVLTPQPQLRREDSWWVELMSGDNTVFKGLPFNQSASADPVYAPWIRLMNHVGIPTECISSTGEAAQRLRENGMLFLNDILAFINAD